MFITQQFAGDKTQYWWWERILVQTGSASLDAEFYFAQCLRFLGKRLNEITNGF
jgi:hypothetical protein